MVSFIQAIKVVHYIHGFAYVALLNVWAKSYLVVIFYSFSGLLILFVTRASILLS